MVEYVDVRGDVLLLQVKQLVLTAERKAEKLLRKHRRQLKAVAMELLERETLSGEEISNLLDPSGSYRRKIDKLRARMQQGEQPNWFQRLVVRVKRAFDWMFLPKDQTELAVETALAEGGEELETKKKTESSGSLNVGSDKTNNNDDSSKRKEKAEKTETRKRSDAGNGGRDDSDSNNSSGPRGSTDVSRSIGSERERSSNSKLPSKDKKESSNRRKDGTRNVNKAETKEELRGNEEKKSDNRDGKSVENMTSSSGRVGNEDGKQPRCDGQGSRRKNVDGSTSQDDTCGPSRDPSEAQEDLRDLMLGSEGAIDSHSYLVNEDEEDPHHSSHGMMIGDVFIPSHRESGETVEPPRYATLTRHADNGRLKSEDLSKSLILEGELHMGYPSRREEEQEETSALTHETRQKVRPHDNSGVSTLEGDIANSRGMDLKRSDQDINASTASTDLESEILSTNSPKTTLKKNNSQCGTTRSSPEVMKQEGQSSSKGDARKRVQRQWQLTPWGMGLVTVTRDSE